MSGLFNKGPASRADLAALLRHVQNSTKYETYCHLPGRIERFYPEDQTADVSLPIQKFFDGLPREMPILPKCPVFLATGGATGRITMPIAAGDSCLVAVADRDIDNWWLTGNASVPKSRRSHDLSDSFVLVGFRHKGNKVTDYSSTAIEIKNLGSTIKEDAAIKATASGGGVAELTADARMESANGAKAILTSKVRLANSSTDLKSVLDLLVDTIKAQVDTRGDSLSAGTLFALDSVKTQIAALLT